MEDSSSFLAHLVQISQVGEKMSSANDTAGPSSAPSASTRSAAALKVARIDDAEPSTSKVTKRRKIQIIQVSAQPSPSPSDPIETCQSSSLLALPDICLAKIVSGFNLTQLYRAANVCRRLREVAVAAFHLQYRNRYLSYVGQCNPWPAEISTRAFFMNCLRIFSPRNIRVSLDYFHTVAEQLEVIEAIREYCPNLEAIDIQGRIEQPNSAVLAAIRAMLPKLRKIAVPAMDVWNEDARVDWHVEELHIYSHHSLRMPGRTLPRLERLKLTRFEAIDMDGAAVERFMTRNAHIERLEIYASEINHSRLSWLGQRVPNLRSLTLFDVDVVRDYGQLHAAAFASLEYLKITYCMRANLVLDLLVGSPIRSLDVFEIDGAANERIQRFGALSQLVLRRFSSERIDGVLAATRSMAGLRKLRLYMCTTGTITLECIKRLLAELTDITDLHIECNRRAKFDSEQELRQISAMVAVRPELSLRVEVPKRCLKVSKGVERQHAAWLKGVERRGRDCACCRDGDLIDINNFIAQNFPNYDIHDGIIQF